MQTRHLARSLSLTLAGLALAGANVPSLLAQDGPSVQTAAFVRVTAPSVRITSRRGDGDPMLTLPQGTVLETLTKDRGYYWVLLDRDDYGTRRAGFVAERDIEPLTGDEAAARMRGTSRHAAQADSALLPQTTQTEQRTDTLVAATAAEPQAAERVTQTAAPVRSPSGKELCEVLLHFEFGKSELAEDAQQQIERALAELKGDLQGVTYEIEGHADAVGTEPYNDQLGQARAQAVRQYLAERHHVAASQMSIVSYGEARPMAPNDTKAGRAMNRRVLLKILG